MVKIDDSGTWISSELRCGWNTHVPASDSTADDSASEPVSDSTEPVGQAAQWSDS